VWRAPPGRPSRAPRWWGAPGGGGGRRRGWRRGAPGSVQGPIRTGHLEATGVWTGRPPTTGRHHTPSVPRVKTITPPSPIPPVHTASLLGRGGHDILEVVGSDTAGGDDDPECGARRAPGGDGGLECVSRRAGVGRDAGPVGSPPRGGGGPHQRRGANDGRGQVGRPGDGYRSDQRGTRQYGRRQFKGLDGGHPPGGRGGPVGAGYADGRHQVMCRGLGHSPREGGPSVTPGWWRAPEPGVLDGGESGNLPAPRRSKSTAGLATASRASRAAGWSADEDAAVHTMAAVRVPLPSSRPGTPPAAAAAAAVTPAAGGEDRMEQNSAPPESLRVRPPAVEEAVPEGAESGALLQWTPPHAPTHLGECRLRALYEAIPVPKQGPAWQRWLTRHPVQYKVPAGVTTDLPALLEAADAPWVERVALRLSNVMHGATADDIPPVFAWEWACCSPPYLG